MEPAQTRHPRFLYSPLSAGTGASDGGQVFVRGACRGPLDSFASRVLFHGPLPFGRRPPLAARHRFRTDHAERLSHPRTWTPRPCKPTWTGTTATSTSLQLVPKFTKGQPAHPYHPETLYSRPDRPTHPQAAGTARRLPKPQGLRGLHRRCRFRQSPDLRQPRKESPCSAWWTGAR